jgi:hypothetical protein
MLPDPIADILWEPLMELIEVLGHDESILPDITAIGDPERLGVALFHRKTGKSDRLIFGLRSIAKHGHTSFERN